MPDRTPRRDNCRPLARLLARLVVLTLVSTGGAACRQQSPPPAATAASPAPLAGRITVDGSSTVMPISRALAEVFHQAHPDVKIDVAESGTGGGFQKLCAGEVDMIGASRAMTSAESRPCESRRLEYVEIPMAFDSITVVVSAKNTFVPCLTVPELRRMWEPAAQGRVVRWNQIRSTFPAQPLTLFGPGKSSGTFDYFTLAIVGTERSSRTDYTSSEDDQDLVKGIAADPHALGYFGFAYYVANRDALKLVAIDDGKGCIVPSADAVHDATYQPLSRPLFVYATTAALARPEVKAFARTYVSPDHAARVRELGYVPLPTAALLTMNRRLESGVTGSIFKGRGAVVGVTSDVFQDEERIKNALVR